MATLRQINRRIRSIQTTAKTTRAMSLVAGSKMRRAQLMALSHRPYADAIRALLAKQRRVAHVHLARPEDLGDLGRL